MLVYLKNKHTARVSVPGRRGALEFVNPGQIVAVEEEALESVGRPSEKRPNKRPQAGRDVKRYFEFVDKAAFDAAEYAKLRFQTIERLDVNGDPMPEEDEETIKAKAKAMQSKVAAPVLRAEVRDDAPPVPPPPPPAKK